MDINMQTDQNTPPGQPITQEPLPKKNWRFLKIGAIEIGFVLGLLLLYIGIFYAFNIFNVRKNFALGNYLNLPNTSQSVKQNAIAPDNFTYNSNLASSILQKDITEFIQPRFLPTDFTVRQKLRNPSNPSTLTNTFGIPWTDQQKNKFLAKIIFQEDTNIPFEVSETLTLSSSSAIIDMTRYFKNVDMSKLDCNNSTFCSYGYRDTENHQHYFEEASSGNLLIHCHYFSVAVKYKSC